MWGLFRKPWNKDPVFQQPGFIQDLYPAVVETFISIHEFLGSGVLGVLGASNLGKNVGMKSPNIPDAKNGGILTYISCM